MTVKRVLKKGRRPISHARVVKVLEEHDLMNHYRRAFRKSIRRFMRAPATAVDFLKSGNRDAPLDEGNEYYFPGVLIRWGGLSERNYSWWMGQLAAVGAISSSQVPADPRDLGWQCIRVLPDFERAEFD